MAFPTLSEVTDDNLRIEGGGDGTSAATVADIAVAQFSESTFPITTILSDAFSEIYGGVAADYVADEFTVYQVSPQSYQAAVDMNTALITAPPGDSFYSLSYDSTDTANRGEFIDGGFILFNEEWNGRTYRIPGFIRQMTNSGGIVTNIDAIVYDPVIVANGPFADAGVRRRTDTTTSFDITIASYNYIDDLAGGELIVGIRSRFDDEICLPNVDTSAGTVLGLDADNCIIGVAGGTGGTGTSVTLKDVVGAEPDVPNLDELTVGIGLAYNTSGGNGATIFNSLDVKTSTAAPRNRNSFTVETLSFDNDQFTVGYSSTSSIPQKDVLVSLKNPSLVTGTTTISNDDIEVSSGSTDIYFFADDFTVTEGTNTAGDTVTRVRALDTLGVISPGASPVSAVHTLNFGSAFNITGTTGQADIGINFPEQTGVPSQYVHEQTSAAATWSVKHDLENLWPIVNVYEIDGGTSSQVIPESIVAVSLNELTITFQTNVTGVATVVAAPFTSGGTNPPR